MRALNYTRMVEFMSLRLNMLTWGEGYTRALLLHGLNSSAATWGRLAGPLTRELGCTALAPDLRGHGRSPRGQGYLIGDYVGDLVALGSEWDLVVGHSLGGLIAAHAAQDEDWTRRLVLIDPALDIDEAVFDAVAEANLGEIADPPSAVQFQRANPRWSDEDARLKAEAVRRASPEMVERTLFDNAPWRHAHLLASVAIPTLVLGADPALDAVFGPDQGQEASANPFVTYEAVGGAGHSVHRDDPDAVVAAIRDWASG